ncbi:hypothetical protein KGF56_003022 [Candida oxycetoniae]|uniref:Genetic interactor of prohibitin 5, mitochondrial n=1 Tax=Candida oxycetoniae TaxID=497107 RepID=A0AAI9WXD4_9ASCO|nr:uncharacterized protein KGF56_003022 [Candida oxycetoniae]KAI3404122.1 hypothetical protein KGF56_003022 [Candida oxycetoniae]
MRYKQLHRQLRRLPLPRGIISDGAKALKRDFVKERVDKYERLFKVILEDEKYHQIPMLLNAIYQRDTPCWYLQFQKMPYIRLKKQWPTLHLIDEITNDKRPLETYHRQLQKQTPFLVSEHIDTKEGCKSWPVLPLMRKYSGQQQEEGGDNIGEMINQVHRRYKFILLQNVFGITKHTFEMVYTPTKMGLPVNQPTIDGQLRRKISTVKRALMEVQPILANELEKLTFASKTKFNQNFYRWLKHKRRDQTVPQEIKKNIIKERIVSDAQFNEIVQEYIRNQYYYDKDTQQYKMNHKSEQSELVSQVELQKVVGFSVLMTVSATGGRTISLLMTVSTTGGRTISVSQVELQKVVGFSVLMTVSTTGGRTISVLMTVSTTGGRTISVLMTVSTAPLARFAR